MATDLQQKRHEILRIAAHHGARNVRVFGSVVRGDDRADSDVDLLVDMDPDRSLLDVVGLGQDLEELLRAHIREAISDIDEYTSVGRDGFMADRMRQDAVIRKLEIIGEAVKQLTDATKQSRPDIPWKQIAGMRDRLTNHYFSVDLALVWRVIERDVPALRAAVEALL